MPKTPNDLITTPPRGVADQQFEDFLRHRGLQKPPEYTPPTKEENKRKIIMTLLQRHLMGGQNG